MYKNISFHGIDLTLKTQNGVRFHSFNLGLARYLQSTLFTFLRVLFWVSNANGKINQQDSKPLLSSVWAVHCSPSYRTKWALTIRKMPQE